MKARLTSPAASDCGALRKVSPPHASTATPRSSKPFSYVLRAHADQLVERNDGAHLAVDDVGAAAHQRVRIHAHVGAAALAGQQQGHNCRDSLTASHGLDPVSVENEWLLLE